MLVFECHRHSHNFISIHSRCDGALVFKTQLKSIPRIGLFLLRHALCARTKKRMLPFFLQITKPAVIKPPASILPLSEVSLIDSNLSLIKTAREDL
ncbi:MAG: hypothetical protein ACI9JR_002005 [Gammaproteobacteria bacterium]|jgi:hypothetical protein